MPDKHTTPQARQKNDLQTGQNGQKFCINRRQSLIGLLFIAVATTFATISRLTFAFLQPAKPTNSYGGIIEAGPLGNLLAVDGDPNNYPQGRFWLVHSEQGLSALHSSCTHLECLFGWDPEKKVFICPCHGSEFTREGVILTGPAQRNLDRFPLVLVDENGTTLRHSHDTLGQPVRTDDLLALMEKSAAPESVPKEKKDIFIRVDTSRKIISS